MDALSLIIGLVLGATAGGAVAFFAGRARQTAAQAAEHAAAELARSESASLKQELAQTRERASTAEQAHAGTKATLAAVTARAQELLAAAKAERDRADAEATARATLQADFSALRTELNERERNLREQAELLTRAQEQLKATFEATGAKVLQASAEQLLKQAREQFEGQKKLSEQDLAARQQAIDATLKPLQEQLAKQEALVTALGEKREGDAKALTEQLRQISELQQAASTAAQRLSSALSDNRQRGRWGEVALRQVVEMAGLEAGIHFDEQTSVAGQDGRLRPDMVVKLPGERTIAIDSKVPLAAYLASIESAATEAERTAARTAHAEAVRSHVKALASRGYADAIGGTTEFVVLFIPVESAFTAAFEADPSLHADAMDQYVLVVTPSTLLALLRTVAMHWSNVALAENAARIGEHAKDLVTRLRTFAEHLAKVGTQLSSATNAYNKAVGSFESRLLPGANRVAEMTASDAVEAPEQISALPRQLELPESTEPS
jgi:DNA recombination protein RmuC